MTVALRGRDGIAVTGELQTGELVVVAHESVLLQLGSGDPVTIAGSKQP